MLGGRSDDSFVFAAYVVVVVLSSVPATGSGVERLICKVPASVVVVESLISRDPFAFKGAFGASERDKDLVLER